MNTAALASDRFLAGSDPIMAAICSACEKARERTNIVQSGVVVPTVENNMAATTNW
jgi:hypothetical protein